MRVHLINCYARCLDSLDIRNQALAMTLFARTLSFFSSTFPEADLLY